MLGGNGFSTAWAILDGRHRNRCTRRTRRLRRSPISRRQIPAATGLAGQARCGLSQRGRPDTGRARGRVDDIDRLPFGVESGTTRSSPQLGEAQQAHLSPDTRHCRNDGGRAGIGRMWTGRSENHGICRRTVEHGDITACGSCCAVTDSQSERSRRAAVIGPLGAASEIQRRPLLATGWKLRASRRPQERGGSPVGALGR